jgi:hypothetical protein
MQLAITMAVSWAFNLRTAYSQAAFLEDAAAAPDRHIPGAIEGVVSAGVLFENLWVASLAAQSFAASAKDLSCKTTVWVGKARCCLSSGETVPYSTA